MNSLVLGTHNAKKGTELRLLLEPLGVQLLTLADYPHAIAVVEDGDSFEANATLKAVQQARHLNLWVLGEDSGLCVDALDGAPGIFSARFAPVPKVAVLPPVMSPPVMSPPVMSPPVMLPPVMLPPVMLPPVMAPRGNSPDIANNQHLLQQLANVPWEKRTAHYVCHMTLSDPAGKVHADFEATCSGRIRFEPVGDAGFGYDPLFEIPEYHRTFGQLGNFVKSILSHRARATRQMVQWITTTGRSGRSL